MPRHNLYYCSFLMIGYIFFRYLFSFVWEYAVILYSCDGLWKFGPWNGTFFLAFGSGGPTDMGLEVLLAYGSSNSFTNFSWLLLGLKGGIINS